MTSLIDGQWIKKIRLRWWTLVVLYRQMTTAVEENTIPISFGCFVQADDHSRSCAELCVVILLSCHICCVWWPVMWLHSPLDYKITSNWKQSQWNTMSRLQNKWSVHCALGHITNISDCLLLQRISVDIRGFFFFLQNFKSAPVQCFFGKIIH